MLSYFKSSILATVIGLLACAGIGFYYSGTYTGAVEALFIASVLAVLEVSLSFDNAIVNAVILKEMTPLWRHRFLTWGMLIAVFGMRLVFPLLIVAVVAGLGPYSALVLAATEPAKYAEIMLHSHLVIAAFGGVFLLMVALKYFYDETKDVHWIQVIEKPLAKLGKLESIESGLVLISLITVTEFLPEAERFKFLVAGISGLICFIIVDGIGAWLEGDEKAVTDLHKASAGMFIYLEVLDASFSFDGVVGAFAITNNLFIIMIGLSIGAFFVRSLTVMFVEKDTLTNFKYLEHGAFYAIFALAVIMLTDAFLHIPEWVTGMIGAVIIVAAFVSSLRELKARGSALS